MIKINELLVHPTINKLIVDVEIDSLSYYTGMFIKDIKIDTSKTFKSTGASDKAYTYNATELPSLDMIDLNIDAAFEGNLPYAEDIETEFKNGRKRVRLILDTKALNINNMNELFFIYVTTDGVIDPSTPCYLDNRCYTLVTYNELHVKDNFMYFVSNLANLHDLCGKCSNVYSSLNQEFMGAILNYNAFKMSIDTGRFVYAVKLWNKLFVNSHSSKSCNTCG